MGLSTYWNRDEMDAILKTVFWNDLFDIINSISLEISTNYFPLVNLKYISIGLDNGPVPYRWQAII